MMTKQFDIAEFEAFCRSKPAGEAYIPYSSTTCALAQFGFPHLGFGDVCRNKPFREAYEASVYCPEKGPRRPGYFTFGSLADRLSSLEANGNG